MSEPTDEPVETPVILIPEGTLPLYPAMGPVARAALEQRDRMAAIAAGLGRGRVEDQK